MEEKKSGRQAEAEQEICVCAIYNGVRGELFEADSALDLLQLAQLLRARMDEPGPEKLDLAEAFGAKRPIDRESFDLLTAEFMKGARHIRGMFSIDTGRKKVSALDRAEGWMDYHFKDLSAAVYYACRKEDRAAAERRAIFLSRLKGKTLNHPLHPEAELTFGMRPDR